MVHSDTFVFVRWSLTSVSSTPLGSASVASSRMASRTAEPGRASELISRSSLERSTFTMAKFPCWIASVRGVSMYAPMGFTAFGDTPEDISVAIMSAACVGSVRESSLTAWQRSGTGPVFSRMPWE